MLDANLCFCDGTLDWTYANVVTSNYGTPTSTTKNAMGMGVLDLGSGSAGRKGGAVVLILTEAAAAVDDALTVIVEESDTEAFTTPHELGKIDILAATKGVIIGSETPTTVVFSCIPTRRYLRIDASCVADDDFKTVYAYWAPHPYKDL
jgi:hypothetical protein